MANRRTTVLGAVLAALTLGGCSQSYLDILAFDEEAVLRRGWYPAHQQHEQTVYCYRTISSPECHEAPLPGENHRLIGHFGALPDAE